MQSPSFSSLLPREWVPAQSSNPCGPSSTIKFLQPSIPSDSAISPSNPLENKNPTFLNPLLAHLQMIVETQKVALNNLKEKVEKQHKSWLGVETFLKGVFPYPKYVLQVNRNTFFPIFEFFIFKINILENSLLNKERLEFSKEGLEQLGSKGVRAIVLFVSNCLKIYFLHTFKKNTTALCQAQDVKQILENKENLRTRLPPDSEVIRYLDELERVQNGLQELQQSVQGQLEKAEQEISKSKNLFDSFYFLVTIGSYLISSSCKIALKIAKPLYHIQDSNYELNKIEKFQKLSQKKQEALKLTQEIEFSTNISVKNLLQGQTDTPKKTDLPSILKEINFSITPFSQKLLRNQTLQETASEIYVVLDAEKSRQLLMKREEKRTKSIESYLEPYIKQCEKFSSGEEVQCYVVRNLEINLQELPKQFSTAPQDKATWLSALKNHSLHSFFAKKHIGDLEREETKAILLQRGLYQALLSKHKREEQVLSVRKFEQRTRFLFSCFQISLLPLGKFTAPFSILNWLIEDLTKHLTGLSLAYLIFPDYKFKLEAIVCFIAEHGFSKMYQPHAYSLEGYQLRFEKRGIIIFTYLLKVKYVFEEAIIWMKFQTIEFSLLRTKQTPEAREHRYKEMTKSVGESRLQWEKRLANIENRLQLLRNKDAAFTVSPRFISEQQNQTIFDVLQEEIEKINFAYAPKVKGWVEQNMKICLDHSKTTDPSENSKNKSEIKEQLSQFFSQSCEEFLQA